MTSPQHQYTLELYDRWGYRATWLPTSRLQIGDCGPVRDGVFSPQARIDDFGVVYSVSAGSDPVDFEYASQSGVSYGFQLAASTQSIPEVPQGSAGVEISFASENGVVFVARDAVERRIERIDVLNDALRALTLGGTFRRDYAVVTHAVDAASGTVLISSGRQGRFVAKADADLTAGLLDLANARLNLTRVAVTNLHSQFVAEKGLTPLFKLVGFKKGGIFAGAPSFDALRFDDDDHDPGDLDELSPEDTPEEE